MKPKNQRLAILSASIVSLGVAAFFVLSALNENITFFYSPNDLAHKDVPLLTKIRVGGMVEAGSVDKQGLRVDFRITDFQETLKISFEGVLPDLFREGQGVVADGQLVQPGHFVAETILAKHDENYMPPEIADLKPGAPK